MRDSDRVDFYTARDEMEWDGVRLLSTVWRKWTDERMTGLSSGRSEGLLFKRKGADTRGGGRRSEKAVIILGGFLDLDLDGSLDEEVCDKRCSTNNELSAVSTHSHLIVRQK